MRSVAAIFSLLLATSCLAADAKLVVHEWGTFTSLQDESGRSIGGINIDDEPLPDFVRTQESSLVRNSPGFNDRLVKDVVPLHPDVTMRLETPVMYFYPPKDAKLPMTIDVSVDFRGGWLTQFYPGALVTLPGFDPRQHAGKISEETIGNLTWKKLQIGTNTEGPKTDSKIWLAPRQVRAVGITSIGGESEKYLFYRGVGHLDSPLHVIRTSNGKQFQLFVRSAPGQFMWLGGGPEHIWGWLVQVNSAGKIAFRKMPRLDFPGFDTMEMKSIKDGKVEQPPEIASTFVAADFADANDIDLREQLHEKLVSEGLYDDEATAMLNTWEHSYFQSPGLRLFFIVPHSWANAVLPLKVSVPADITRVMVGRIELITSQQRTILKRSTSGGASREDRRELGRFADAMLADQQR